MKFETDRLAMLEVAKNMARVAPAGSAIDVLNKVLIEGNDDTGEVFMTATNHEVVIQQKVKASVEEGGVMLMDARFLMDMLKLMSGEFVTFEALRPELLRIRSGTCRYEIKCLPAKHYPKPVIPFPEETIKMTGINSLAKRTVFAISKDDSKPALQCVNVKVRNNAVHAAACDGVKLIMIKDTAGSPDKREFLLPGRSLQMLASISDDSDVFEVGDTGKEVVFVRSDMLFVIRKMSTGSFVDTNALIKNMEPVYTAVANADIIREALNIVAVGSENTPVNIALSGEQIIFRRSGDHSEVQTSVKANISKDTKKSGFLYDIRSLEMLFQVVDGRVKLELDAKGFMLVKTRNEVYFQAPIQPRINKAESVKKAA
jgi:DNA polymerase-3 subunit beta